MKTFSVIILLAGINCLFGERILSGVTNRWLGANRNGTLYLMDKNALSLKQWSLEPVEGLFSVLTDLNDKCLDANVNGNVFTSECDRSESQLWQNVERNLVNKETLQCLTSDSAGVISTRTCNDSLEQIWLVQKNFLNLP